MVITCMRMQTDMATTAPDQTTDQNPPTIFSRLERLDIMMGFLEEITRGSGRANRSSCASTASSGSDGGGGGGEYYCSSSVASTSPCLEERRRRRRLRLPLGEAVREAQLKGPLLDRLHHLEDRVFKLSLHLEEELMECENGKKKKDLRGGEEKSPRSEQEHHDHRHQHTRMGAMIKSLVKSCVRGKHKSTPRSQ